MVRKIIAKCWKIVQISLLFIGIFYVQKITMTDETKVMNLNLNKTLDLHAMADIIAEINYENKYAILDSYVGYLTGYGADCPLCSGRLGCTGMDVTDGQIEYQDIDYGKVRIVASSRNLACGTIIQFESPRVAKDPVLAIVLDRGVSGTSIDILTPSENYARSNIGRSQIKYDVLRDGWNR